MLESKLELLQHLRCLLEIPNLAGDPPSEIFSEWDSLKKMGLLAWLYENGFENISVLALENCQSFDELLRLLE